MKIILMILILLAPTFGQTKNNFWAMYNLHSIPEKKEIWNQLTRDEQIEAQRLNFAWGVGYLHLDSKQIAYLDRLSDALPTITLEEANDFQDEAIDLFPTGGDILFGSIGPYRPCNPLSRKLPTERIFQLANCPCSVGSSFNMSCESECTEANNRCTMTSGGCGFAWLYACRGYCTAS